MALTVDDIRSAAAILEDRIVRTPTVRSGILSEELGADVFLKLETLQRTGSFKDRGAFVKLSRLNDEERARGVIAVSAGNHAQGVAAHAQRLGVPATILMPVGTPFTKVRRTEAFGATVILEGDTLNAAEPAALAKAEAEGLTFVHPYDDVDIIAGQGTIGLEMLEDVPDLDAVLVPIGGGGIISGYRDRREGDPPRGGGRRRRDRGLPPRCTTRCGGSSGRSAGTRSPTGSR